MEKLKIVTDLLPVGSFPTIDPFDEIVEMDRSPISPTSGASPASKKAVDRSPHAPSNKLVEQIIRTPNREPSPQPAHFSIPYGNGQNGENRHRVLRSATVGYIAPTFVGKAAQMEEGQYNTLTVPLLGRA